MIRVAAHSRNNSRHVLPEDALRDVFVRSCGYQHFMSRDYSIRRPEGMQDYQILYIYKGWGSFYLNGAWERMPEDSIILYRPGQPQIYTYQAADNPEIYWIHFLGTKSDSLVEQYQIRNTKIEKDRMLKQLFQDIILELQLKKPFFEEVAVADFQKLLALIYRHTQQKYTNLATSTQIDKLIVSLNENYMKPWNIETMADFCHLSVDYFSHQFKLATGLPPIRFLNQLRIEHAKEILLSEDMTVAEVSNLVGYGNPLYFSRVFKKITGLSPKAYNGNRNHL